MLLFVSATEANIQIEMNRHFISLISTNSYEYPTTLYKLFLSRFLLCSTIIIKKEVIKNNLIQLFCAQTKFQEKKIT